MLLFIWKIDSRFDSLCPNKFGSRLVLKGPTGGPFIFHRRQGSVHTFGIAVVGRNSFVAKRKQAAIWIFASIFYHLHQGAVGVVVKASVLNIGMFLFFFVCTLWVLTKIIRKILMATTLSFLDVTWLPEILIWGFYDGLRASFLLRWPPLNDDVLTLFLYWFDLSSVRLTWFRLVMISLVCHFLTALPF